MTRIVTAYLAAITAGTANKRGMGDQIKRLTLRLCVASRLRLGHDFKLQRHAFLLAGKHGVSEVR
jgi:hypothetical protein